MAAPEATEVVPSSRGPGTGAASAVSRHGNTSSSAPLANEVQARARHSRASPVTTSSGSAISHISTVRNPPVETTSFQWAASSSDAPGKSRPAIAWLIASVTSPRPLEPARRAAMKLRYQLGRLRVAAPRSDRRGTGGGSGTSRAGHRAGPRTDSSARGSPASAPSPSVSATASHSGPFTRSRIDVRSSSPRVSGSRSARTSSPR